MLAHRVFDRATRIIYNIFYVVMDGVINGFSEMPLDQRKGLKDMINSTVIRGLWTWSRGGDTGGWWGPYIHTTVHVKCVCHY